MGTYYHYAEVHGKILVWWTDNDGGQHQQWLEGEAAEEVLNLTSKQDFQVQQLLRRSLGL